MKTVTATKAPPPPKWVLDYQKGEGSRWNTRPSSKVNKARKPTIEEVEENDSN